MVANRRESPLVIEHLLVSHTVTARNSTVRCQPAPSGRPALVGQAGPKVGDQRGSRKTALIPAAPRASAARQASSSLTARSEQLHRAFETRPYRGESVGRPEFAVVSRHRVESLSPVSLYADSHRAGHDPPSLL